MKTIKSSYSKGMLISSIVLSIFLLSIEINLIYTLIFKRPDTFIFWIILLGILSIAGGTIYLYWSQIIGLSITDEYLIIMKRRGRIVIPRSDILEVTPTKTIIWDMSLWGTCGLFGQIGWFRSSKFGNYFALANNGNSLIFIRTNRRKYVVSCNNRGDIIESLKQTNQKLTIF